MHIITRKIEIDAGHRIAEHDSKCRNLHGHRYVIEATISGDLIQTGSEAGMVKDFGYLKSVMMAEIDDVFDHTLILSIDDPIITNIAPSGTSGAIRTKFDEDHYSYYEVQGLDATRVILIKPPPTAENLAAIWFHILRTPLMILRAVLVSIKVFETPNCWAVYTPGS